MKNFVCFLLGFAIVVALMMALDGGPGWQAEKHLDYQGYQKTRVFTE